MNPALSAAPLPVGGVGSAGLSTVGVEAVYLSKT
jgi:hypothetical protein